MKIKYALLTLLTIASVGSTLLSSCTKNKLAYTNETIYKQLKTSEAMLTNAGIDQISYAIAGPCLLIAKYDNPNTGLTNKISLTEDTVLRTSEIKGSNGVFDFTMKIDTRNKTFTFRSSRGDDYSFVAKIPADIESSSGQFYDIKTKQPVKNDWFLNTKADYKVALLAHALLGELYHKKLFKSQMTLIAERDATLMLRAKILELSQAKPNKDKLMLEAPGGKCEIQCKTDLYYNWWSTQACNEAYNAIASACSNSQCIGDCGVRSCDCFGVAGDFAVICRAFSKACGEMPVVVN